MPTMIPERHVNSVQRKPTCRTLDSIVQKMTERTRKLNNINPIARRLALTREILSLRPMEFAESAGVALSRYNRWETGKCSLPLSCAIALCVAHDLTLDWLYRGKVQGLPIWLVVEVKACSLKLGWEDRLVAS